MKKLAQWHRLGRVEYADGLEIQRQFQEARRRNDVPDTLLLLEHPSVLTLGRGASEGNILLPTAQLEAKGVEVFETDRGGDVTYHGPGQLVGYPMLFLEPGQQDVRKYVRAIEEVIIRTVAEWGVVASRIEKWPGVWVTSSRRGGPRKLAALGVHLSRWYTKHGFALNVSTDLSHFDLIVPCGIREAGVSSMREELDTEVDLRQVEERIAHHFQAVFDLELVAAAAPKQTVCVVVLADDGRVLLLKRSPVRGGFWQPVTGRVEANETPDAAAARELREETGVECPVRSLQYEHVFALGEESSSPTLIRESAYVAHSGQSARINSSEHTQLRWCSPQEAIAMVPHAGLSRAIRLALLSRP